MLPRFYFLITIVTVVYVLISAALVPHLDVGGLIAFGNYTCARSGGCAIHAVRHGAARA